jgi:hypothetical protein
MTPARKRALQWIHDRGAVLKQLAEPDAPSADMLRRMEEDGQAHVTSEGWTLTDKGRRQLHEGF